MLFGKHWDEQTYFAELVSGSSGKEGCFLGWNVQHDTAVPLLS